MLSFALAAKIHQHRDASDIRKPLPLVCAHDSLVDPIALTSIVSFGFFFITLWPTRVFSF